MSLAAARTEVAHLGIEAKAINKAAHEVAQAAIEMGERVIENDPHGRAVTIDLYAHSLNVATKHRLHPVRVLTAADDIIRGLRDYMRGPKPAPYGYFGNMIVPFDVSSHFLEQP